MSSVTSEYGPRGDAALIAAFNSSVVHPVRAMISGVPIALPFAEGRDRAKIASEIDAFNAVNREEAASAGARYVDVTAISRRGDPAFVAADQLHPSSGMYAAWTEAIAPEAAAALSGGRSPSPPKG